MLSFKPTFSLSSFTFIKRLFSSSLLSAFHLKRRKAKSLSRVRLFATPWTVAYQAPPSMGFSRQECWSGLPFPSPGNLPNPGIEPRSPALQADALPSEPPGKPKTDSATPWTNTPGSSVHENSSGKNAGVGCHALLQGNFPTYGSKAHLLCLLHCRWILYLLTHWKSPGSNKTFQENRSYLSFLEWTLIFSYPISF